MCQYLKNYNRRDAIKKMTILTVGTAAYSLTYGNDIKWSARKNSENKNKKILSTNNNSEKGSNAIFYFSGTGNSLKVAQDMANIIPNFKIIPISKYQQKDINRKFDRIGIVCPVYAYGPPMIVLEFLESLTSKHKDSYIFCAITYRDDAGATLKIVSEILEERKLKLDAGFGIKMPGNHIAYYDLDNIKLQNQKFKSWEKQLKEITPIIKQRKEYCEDDYSFVDKVIKSSILYSMASKRFRKSDKKFELNGNCSGCQICSKVCPVDNIDFINNKPLWKNRCEQCLACLSWCPKQSIDFGKKTINKPRYRHPKISIKQMII